MTAEVPRHGTVEAVTTIAAGDPVGIVVVSVYGMNLLAFTDGTHEIGSQVALVMDDKGRLVVSGSAGDG